MEEEEGEEEEEDMVEEEEQEEVIECKIYIKKNEEGEAPRMGPRIIVNECLI